MKLLKITQTYFDDIMRLVMKGISSKNTLTAEEYGAYGMDSRPPKDIIVLYTPTELIGSEAIIGVLNKNRKSEIGEARLFCTDADGNFKFNIWLRADGTILVGDSEAPADFTNFGVKFNELKTEFNTLKTDFNNLVNAYNGHIHPASGVIGTPPAVAVTVTTTLSQASPNTSNIDNAKNDKFKTN